MSTSWERVEEIFLSALRQEPGARRAYLDAACGDDELLRGEVESLLASHERAGEFIEAPAVAFAPSLPAFAPGDDASAALAWRQVGPYRIERELARGGMGAVFLARRADDEYEKQVAVKLIAGGAGDRLVTQRFLGERQILANLDHPNIARLIDGGRTADGSPFLVMEYVEGVRIDEYCDGRRLSIDGRLQLFRAVCAAVSYAHRNLVVHRDIKPSNILITADGTPKLLDFGIAKLLDDGPAQLREQTATRALMTPQYASPEQVRGEGITTASDIYSLGVLLYELLTGHHPYRLKTLLPSEIEKVICETEPERPSAAVSRVEEASGGGAESGTITPASVSEARGEQPAGLRRRLKGDLDNIVLMAMRKEPERRYSSVEQFSEDIRRHLEGLPVVATKNTFGYRAGKFVGRHKAGVGATLLVALALVGGIVATAWQARRAEQQRARAERRFNEIRRLSHSLMFEIHDSVQNLPGSTPTRQLIVSRALEYLDSLAQESGDDPSLQRELATAYEKIGDIQGNPYSANLGDTEGALASYRKAVGIREAMSRSRATTDAQMELGRSYRGMGDILEQKGDVGDCLSYYRRSLSIFESLAAANPTDKSVRDELARAYETLGDGLGRTDNAAERLQSYKQALAIREDLLAQSPSDPKLRRSVGLNLMKVGGASGEDKVEAAEYLRRSVEMLEELAAEQPQNARALREVGFVYYQLGITLTEVGDYEGALESRRKSFAIREKIASQDPQNKQARFDLAVAYADLSEAYTNANAPDEAFAQGQRSLEILRELSFADPTNAVYLRNIGLCYEKLAQAAARSASDERAPAARRIQQWREARSWYQKALELFTALRDRNMLMPSDAGQVERFAGKVAESENAIGQLTSRKS